MPGAATLNFKLVFTLFCVFCAAGEGLAALKFKVFFSPAAELKFPAPFNACRALKFSFLSSILRPKFLADYNDKVKLLR